MINQAKSCQSTNAMTSPSQRCLHELTEFRRLKILRPFCDWSNSLVQFNDCFPLITFQRTMKGEGYSLDMHSRIL